MYKVQKDKTKKTKQQKGKKPSINTTPLYIALIILLVIYVFEQGNSSIALFSSAGVFLLIIVLLVTEITNGVRETGYVGNVVEILAAVVIVVVIWYGLRFILNTPNPLDVVPSCSMLPTLQRGDLIALQGIGSSVSSIDAPVVNVTKSEAATITSGNNESLECVAYRYSGDTIYYSQYMQPGYSLGLYKSTPYGGEIVPPGAQSKNLVQYACGIQHVRFDNGTILSEAYTSSISILNKTIHGDANNSIIVYKTVPSDSFYQEGDSFIVHRVYAVLNASGEYYFLTKGDNNPGLDMQYSNYPANTSQVQGKVLFSLPYIGYLKLILSSTPTPPAGCNSTVVSA
jgi:signal peptidase I